MVDRQMYFPVLVSFFFILMMLLVQLIGQPNSSDRSLVKELRGKLEKKSNRSLPDTLVINVWASWCKPCIKEMPRLARIAKKAKRLDYDHIGFYSITEDTEEEAKSLKKSQQAYFETYKVFYNDNKLASPLQAIYKGGKNSIPINVIIIGDTCVFKGGYTGDKDENAMKKLLFSTS